MGQEEDPVQNMEESLAYEVGRKAYLTAPAQVDLPLRRASRMESGASRM